tara:strand:- start:216 stop:758 length:543 start_codon:yes stop_codon:yes gene_type:complete
MLNVDDNESKNPNRGETILADKSQRLLSFFLDLLFAASVEYFFIFIFRAINNNSLTLISTLTVLTFISIQGYLLINTGQTIGKRLMKIRIVHYKNLNIPPLKNIFILRFVLIFNSPNLLAYFFVFSDKDVLNSSGQLTIFGKYLLLIFIIVFAQTLLIFRNDRRCGHDILSGTIVEKVID